MLDLIEHQDQTHNSQAGPSAYTLPPPIPSPYVKTVPTPLTPISRWPLPQTPLDQYRPPPPPIKAEVDVTTGQYMDADGFSDLLIGSDRQAEMMADS